MICGSVFVDDALISHAPYTDGINLFVCFHEIVVRQSDFVRHMHNKWVGGGGGGRYLAAVTR